MAHLGIRPGEARALEVADCHDGWLTVDKAVKGKTTSAPVRGTKTGKPKRLPIGEDLAEWIDEHVEPEDRLTRTPLFPNPRTGKRYAQKTLQAIWSKALEKARMPPISLYEGTKHSFATDAIRRGVSERLLQKFLGHANAESTRRYARLADTALVQVLPTRPWRQAGDKGPEEEGEQDRGVGGGPSWTRTRDLTVMSRLL